MPAALKKPTLDELYRRLSCTGGEGRESAMETLVGCTSNGISNQDRTNWLSWSNDGDLREFGLAR